MRPISIKARLGDARRLVSGDTGVVIATFGLQNMLRIVNSVILTRLLNAEAFGVAAIITSISVTFSLLADIGISAFVIRHDRSDDPVFLDEVWTLRMIRALALCTAVAAAAWPLSIYFGKPEMILPIMVGSLFFVFDGMHSLSFITALRSRQVKLLNMLSVIMQLLSMAATVTLALIFRNFWAILLGGFAGQIIQAVFSYAYFPNSIRRWRFSFDRMRELYQFSRFITASTIISLALGQVDKIVFSRIFTLNMLGVYSIASNLATMPIGLAGSYVTQILYPRYAEVKRNDPERFKTIYYSERMPVSLLYTFAVGGLIAAGPIVVRILYDDRYLSVVPFFQMLAVSTLCSIHNGALLEYMIADGRTRYAFEANIVRLAYFAVAMPIAYFTLGANGIVLVVGCLEVAAYLFGMFALWQRSVLKPLNELAILGAGLAGFAVSYVISSVILYELKLAPQALPLHH